MISISCSHPDLEEFIGIKSDLDKITKANISIRLSHDFMKAVKNNEEYQLEFIREATGEVVTKTVNAKEIFRKIAEMNWDYGEPGALFWDTISGYNLLSETESFSYAGTNPCLTGDTLINTEHGEVQIKDLVGQQPWVYCMDDDGSITMRQASKVWKTRKNAQLVLVETARGNIRCTPDHKIHTRNRGWVAASDLKRGDKITGLNRQMKDETHTAVGLSGSKYIPEHRLVAGTFFNIEGKDIHHKDNNTLNNDIDNLEVMEHGEHSKHTNTDRRIKVYRDKFGRYLPKEVKATRRSINLGVRAGTNWTVRNVLWLDEREDVYDMTVPGLHNFVANRMVVHNCAEEPLPAGGSCLLGSINLDAFVKNGKFDYVDFQRTVRIAVVALNDVLDEGLPLHPLQEQRDSVRDWRQIGLGVMGIADMLIHMGIRYGSKEAVELCDDIASTMAKEALYASARLAEQYGPFPKCENDKIMKSEFYQVNTSPDIDALVQKYGLRNSQLLTIAPTGTISTMIGVSGGIEPIFANYYTRKTESLHGEDVYYKVYTPIVERYMKENGITDDKDLPEWFVTAQTLNYHERIQMQAAWQRHIDASISSTVNVPHDFTVEDTEKLYLEAWENGLKGITMFRDGCKRVGVLTLNDESKEAAPVKEYKLQRGDIIQVTDDVIGKKRKLITGCGSLHCTAFFDPYTGDLMETYLSKGSSGGCNNYMIGLSRMISLASRAGCDIHSIIDQLNSCGTCPSYAVRTATKRDTSKGSCCPIAVGNALMEMWKEVQYEINDDIEGDEKPHVSIVPPKVKNACPECGEELVFEGGCNTCKHCGYSKCD